MTGAVFISKCLTSAIMASQRKRPIIFGLFLWLESCDLKTVFAEGKWFEAYSMERAHELSRSTR